MTCLNRCASGPRRHWQAIRFLFGRPGTSRSLAQDDFNLADAAGYIDQHAVVTALADPHTLDPFTYDITRPISFVLWLAGEANPNSPQESKHAY